MIKQVEEKVLEPVGGTFCHGDDLNIRGMYCYGTWVVTVFGQAINTLIVCID